MPQHKKALQGLCFSAQNLQHGPRITTALLVKDCRENEGQVRKRRQVRQRTRYAWRTPEAWSVKLDVRKSLPWCRTRQPQGIIDVASPGALQARYLLQRRTRMRHVKPIAIVCLQHFWLTWQA